MARASLVTLVAGSAVLVGLAQARSASILRVTGATPGASVFVDGIRHGRVDDRGVREIATIRPGKHTVLVRQAGFVDFTQPVVLTSGRPAVVTPKRAPLKDPAESAFQRADFLAIDSHNEEAAAAYQEAIHLRGSPFPAAQIGLARVLTTLKKTDDATAAAAAAIAAEPKNPEAHTVLGTVLRERGLYDEAADEYRKAIALGAGRAAEAHTGLAVTLAEQGDHAGAAKEYTVAIAQNQDAEPVLYQLLGNSLERLDRKREAIAAYERFLALAPTHALAPAVRSLLVRLRDNATEGDEGDVNPYAPKP